MRIQSLWVVLGLALCTPFRNLLPAEPLDSALQAKVDAQVRAIQEWAADPVIVGAVKAQNANPPAEFAAMTQDKWKELTKLEPFVRSFDKSPAGEFLKSKRSDVIIRAFLSDASGRKVAFTTKTLSWSHKGDPKHESPMAGKVWQGAMERDRATGYEQIQIGVPVLDEGRAIGSLVVSLNASNL